MSSGSETQPPSSQPLPWNEPTIRIQDLKQEAELVLRLRAEERQEVPLMEWLIARARLTRREAEK